MVSADPGRGAEDRCGNGLERIYPTTAVRYGLMRHVGEFSHPARMQFSCGGRVVIQTHRGIEIGEQVSLTCHGCAKSVTREQMRAYVKNSGNDYYRLRNGRILREATGDDLTEDRHIVADSRQKIVFCQQLADEAKLAMKVIECDHLFGGERIVFYFRVNGDGRVDFRDLVRLLAAEYQTRIEMRQVGARDEARLVADYETCGRECCCKNFLKTLKPVSMKMAKMQKATLDPSKVSGRCGRLKCCLRYEQESYESLDAGLPRHGERIRTEHGDGIVCGRQILTQLVQFRADDDRIITAAIEDVIERNAPPPERSDGKAEEARATGPSNEGDARSAESAPRRRRRRRPRRETGTGDGSGAAPESRPGEGETGAAPSPTEPRDNDAGQSRPGGGRRRRRRGRGRRGGGGRPDGNPPTPPSDGA